jgi:hypothetical protein
MARGRNPVVVGWHAKSLVQTERESVGGRDRGGASCSLARNSFLYGAQAGASQGVEKRIALMGIFLRSCGKKIRFSDFGAF